MKHCPICGTDRPESDFYRRGARLHSYCKTCHNRQSTRARQHTRAGGRLDDRLDAGPLRRWLLSRGVRAADVAELAGLPERRVRRILYGEVQHVPLDVVDRIILAVDGSPAALNELYPVSPVPRGTGEGTAP